MFASERANGEYILCFEIQSETLKDHFQLSKWFHYNHFPFTSFTILIICMDSVKLHFLRFSDVLMCSLDYLIIWNNGHKILKYHIGSRILSDIPVSVKWDNTFEKILLVTPTEFLKFICPTTFRCSDKSLSHRYAVTHKSCCCIFKSHCIKQCIKHRLYGWHNEKNNHL